jgi:sugar-specific transcriptional regulator TrmB
VSENFSEEITEYLKTLGIEQDMAKIYLMLLRTGASTAGNLSKGSSLDRAKIYRDLKTLQSLNLVEVVGGAPLKFKAVDFETAVESIIRNRENHITQIKSRKETIISKYSDQLRSMGENKDVSMHMRFLEGINSVITGINSFIERADGSINLFLDRRNLIRIYSHHTIVYLSRKMSEGASVRVLLPRSDSISELVSDIMRSFDVRICNLNEPFSYMTSDSKAVFLLLESESNATGNSMSRTVNGILIDSSEATRRFNSMFDFFWDNSEKNRN